ncbi:hypothetical protein DVS28_b0322 (plasmid) [Euzebya pacifica]|uniref:Uncharacterized protein n=1 Tax=Euzebya pacifica TaxID=1608957 RepID=A0A346Y6J5_9ACTN|nr:hypothetical protein [Euzebya pacifica]AXV10092.1 hypothetical protein DVS28_b0322 [Euzebya pacifica]
MPLLHFDTHENDAFTSWIDDNPDGYVVNAIRSQLVGDRTPVPNDHVLHRASCRHFRDDRDYTGTRIKLAGIDHDSVIAGAELLHRATPRTCGACTP